VSALVLCGALTNVVSTLDTVSSPIVVSADNISSGSCGTDATYTLTEDGILTISGTGNMTDYLAYNHDNPFESYRDDIKEVVIEDGITSVGRIAFSLCTSLTDVTIPDSVTVINGQAFLSCTALTEITIPSSVTEIGYEAFGGCSSLTIYGESGSYAETYANENNISFVAIADSPEETTTAPVTTTTKATTTQLTTVETTSASSNTTTTSESTTNDVTTSVSESSIEEITTTTNAQSTTTRMKDSTTTTSASSNKSISSTNTNSDSNKDVSSPKTSDSGVAPIIALGGLLGAVATLTIKKKD
jgi:hypothetical protein